MKMKLEELMNVMEARVVANIFVSETKSIRYAHVYEIWNDHEFLKEYGRKKVVDMQTAGLRYDAVNILIEA